MILCVHTDADARTDDVAINNKIAPALAALAAAPGDLCKILVAVIPVQMTESWMLADIPLLLEEMTTDKAAHDLGLTRLPENCADPKANIKDALRIAQADTARRRRRFEISISDLYLPLGQKIPLEKLSALPSYQKFRDSAKTALKALAFFR